MRIEHLSAGVFNIHERELKLKWVFHFHELKRKLINRL